MVIVHGRTTGSERLGDEGKPRDDDVLCAVEDIGKDQDRVAVLWPDQARGCLEELVVTCSGIYLGRRGGLN